MKSGISLTFRDVLKLADFSFWVNFGSLGQKISDLGL